MRWVRTGLYVIAAIAFLVLLFLIGANLAVLVDQHCCEYEPFENKAPGGNLPWALFRETVADVDAFWTAIASLVGIIAIAFLYDQIVTSNAANAAMLRAYEFSRQSERGRLNLVHMSLNEAKNGIFYELKNTGRSTVVTENHGVKFTPIMAGKGGEKPVDNPNIRPRIWVSHTIEPLATHRYEEALPKSCLGDDGKAEPFLFQFNVFYETAGDKWLYWAAWYYIMDGYMRYTHENFEGEGEVKG